MSNHVELPGYADILKREREVRARAFSAFGRTIAGERVRAMSAGDLLRLDEIGNGFVVQCDFESELEMAAHAFQFVWNVHEDCRIPHGWLDMLRVLRAKRRLAKRLSKRPAGEVYAAIAEYLGDMFYDSPTGAPGQKQSLRSPVASWVAILIDGLCAGGYAWTRAEFLAEPLPCLWQYLRLANHRRNPEDGMSNPSDAWAVKEIDKRNQQRAAKAAKAAEAVEQKKAPPAKPKPKPNAKRKEKPNT